MEASGERRTRGRTRPSAPATLSSWRMARPLPLPVTNRRDVTPWVRAPLLASPRVHHTARGEGQQAALVHVAFDLIAERGFEGLRTRDVAAGAGLNIATLHYYFPTKEDLIRGVVAAAVDQFRSEEGRHQERAPGPADPAARVPRSGSEQMLENPELFTVLLELSTRAIRDPAIRAIMRKTDQDWRAHLAALLRAGSRGGRASLGPGRAGRRGGTRRAQQGRAPADGHGPRRGPGRPGRETERWLTGRQALPPS